MTLVFIATMLQAQQDEKARDIIDKFSEFTTSGTAVSVDFTITMTSLKDDISEKYDGNIILKGNNYKLNIMETETWFDGNSMYTYMPDIQEVMISDPVEDGSFMSDPSQLFNIYHEEFNYRLLGEIIRNDRRLYEIDLNPVDRDHNFHTVKLFINKDDYFMNSAVIAGKDGNRYTINVTDYDDSIEVSDSYFTFNESDYPGVEVIDMRW